MNSIRFRCPACGQILAFNDMLQVETMDEIKNTHCPACKIIISKEEITRQIKDNVSRRIGIIFGAPK